MYGEGDPVAKRARSVWAALAGALWAGLASAGVLVGSLLGCGGGQTRGHPLDSEWSDESGTELRAFAERFAPTRAREDPAVVLGVVDDHTIVGLVPATGHRWTLHHPLSGRPRIAGGLVVGLGGGELFGVDASTGERLWELKSVGTLRGAGDDGKSTIVSIATLSGQRTTVLAVRRDGSVARQIDAPVEIGTPAIFDSYAFLPWDGLGVVVLDLARGGEQARVVSERPVGHAYLLGDQLYFTVGGALLFDEHIVDARDAGGTVVQLPPRALPGDPRWFPPPGYVAPLAAEARDRVRLYARPVATAGGAPRVPHYALGYGRIVVGLDGDDGKTLWARTFDRDLIGGDAGATRLSLCDQRGRVQWLATASGHTEHVAYLGRPLVACEVQAGASDFLPAAAATRPTAGPRAADLYEALQARGDNLLPLQLVLLDDLASLPSDEATERLVDLSAMEGPWGGPRPVVSQRAEALLAARRTGAETMRRRLRLWLDEARPFRQAGTAGAMATALAAMGDPGAAPVLARWLDQPFLPVTPLAAIARACAALATAAEGPALGRFLAQHRCATAPPELVQAVRAAAGALGRLGDARWATEALGGCQPPSTSGSRAPETDVVRWR